MKLDMKDHKLWALWAADCAERTLHYFENLYLEDLDDRPRKAARAGRAWAKGKIKMTEARATAFAAHAAAREADRPAARFAARAAGHAAATAHVFTHAPHAAAYALKAANAAAGQVAASKERAWQAEHFPKYLHAATVPRDVQ